jgi:uncharacterized membrane protein
LTDLAALTPDIRSERRQIASDAPSGAGLVKMVRMGHLLFLLEPMVKVAVDNAFWMTWNLVLAAVPLALAVPVFRWSGRRGWAWWAGLGLVVLFLPNAPYVVTDLIHLRRDVLAARSDGAVISGVLPVYGVFIALGFASYALVLREGGRFLAVRGLGRWRPLAEVATHLVCAVGVVLGRVARLNSWEPVIEPHSTAERVALTLTWRMAPVVVVGTFLVIWAGHAVTRSLGRSAGQALAGLGGRLRAVLEPHLRLGPA